MEGLIPLGGSTIQDGAVFVPELVRFCEVVCIDDPVNLGIVRLEPDADPVSESVFTPHMIGIFTVREASYEIVVFEPILRAIPDGFQIRPLFFEGRLDYSSHDGIILANHIRFRMDGDITFEPVVVLSVVPDVAVSDRRFKDAF